MTKTEVDSLPSPDELRASIRSACDGIEVEAREALAFEPQTEWGRMVQRWAQERLALALEARRGVGVAGYNGLRSLLRIVSPRLSEGSDRK